MLKTFRVVMVASIVAALAAVGCAAAAPQTSPVAAAARTGKVLVIAEENHAYDRIIGSPQAPYLNALAATCSSAANLDAGYPVRCPSLAAYIILTSGSTHRICDDQAPRHHPLTGDNIFHQVRAVGLQWRDYAETAPRRCALTNSADGRYLVRHVPA